jgi:hypothetical protein
VLLVEGGSMKKVSLALGVVGVAPVLGLMAPGVADAAVHAQAGTAATASPAHGKMVRLDNTSGCIGEGTTRGGSPRSLTIWVYHTESNGCVGGVSGLYDGIGAGPGLSMRTRVYAIYSWGKSKVFSGYHNGKEAQAGDLFYQGIHRTYGGSRQQVCAAIVSQGPHHALQNLAPVCVSFPA